MVYNFHTFQQGHASSSLGGGALFTHQLQRKSCPVDTARWYTKTLLLFQRFFKWLWLREADALSFIGVSSLEDQLMLQEVVSSNPITCV